MKLTTSKNANINYLAQIVDICEFRDHPNADRLKLCTVNGCTISTGITTEPGKFIYFPLECQINEDYLRNNNLFRDPSKNLDITQKGFFEDHRRVKCIKLKQIYSEGLIMPISTILSSVKDIDDIENVSFDTIDDILFVQKYTPKYLKTKGTPGKKNKLEIKYEDKICPDHFKFHSDTSQFKQNLFKFDQDTKVQITNKIHGTSAIFAYLPVLYKPNFLQRISNFFYNETSYKHKTFCSSRKVVKDPELNKSLSQGYYSYDIWNLALEIVSPHLIKGMTIYAEIAGYMPNGQCIQKGYDYGCIYDPKTYKYESMSPKQLYDKKLFKIIVYRITMTNFDGVSIEMPYNQIQHYCKIHNLESTEILFEGKLGDQLQEPVDPRDFNDKITERLSELYLEKDCHICKNKVPTEGVVIRMDQMNFEAYKLKSLKFYERETKNLDNNVIDMESDQ